MDIIFLDFDGVLNSAESHFLNEDLKKHIWGIDSRNVIFLNELVKDSGASIVVSSSWRLMGTLNELQAILEKHGLMKDVVIGVTDDLRGYRGEEIQKWLDEHPEVTNYVILDDSSDMLPSQIEHFVRTSNVSGFSLTHLRAAAEILNPDSKLATRLDKMGIEARKILHPEQLYVPVQCRENPKNEV